MRAAVVQRVAAMHALRALPVYKNGKGWYTQACQDWAWRLTGQWYAGQAGRRHVLTMADTRRPGGSSVAEHARRNILHTVEKRGSDAKLGFLGKPGFFWY